MAKVKDLNSIQDNHNDDKWKFAQLTWQVVGFNCELLHLFATLDCIWKYLNRQKWFPGGIM